MSEVTWLLVGTGDIVLRRVAAALQAAQNSRVVGIVGGKDRAARLSAEHDIPEVFEDLDEALEQNSATSVYVATPVDRHMPAAIAALQAGRHVLIEKPLAVNASEAQRICDAAAHGTTKAGCAYYRRTYPRFGHAQEMLAARALGQVVLVRMAYSSWFAPAPHDPKRWRVDRERSGGGPLADMGSHMFDLLIGLFGMPEKVFARADTLVQDYQVEDSSAIVMQLGNGAHVLATFGWNSQTWMHEFEIVGTEARLSWRPADTGAVVLTVGRDTQELRLSNADNVHTPLIQDFVDSVVDDRDPICPVTEAAKTNILLDAIYRSASEGCDVALSEACV